VEEELLARVNYCHLLGHVCSHDYLHVLEGLRQVVRVIVSWLRELDFRTLEVGGVFDEAISFPIKPIWLSISRW